MIQHTYGHEAAVQAARQETDRILATQALADHNDVFSMLYQADYLRTPVIGGVGAMVLAVDDEVELFVNDLPHEETLKTAGGPRGVYSSVHHRMNQLAREIEATGLRSGANNIDKSSGYVIELADQEGAGRFIVPKYTGDLDDFPGVHEALSEKDVQGVMASADLINPAHYENKRDRLGLSAAMRMAAQWKSYALNPHSDEKGNQFSRTLTDEEALKGLQISMQDILAHKPQHDLAVIHAVTGER